MVSDLLMGGIQEQIRKAAELLNRLTDWFLIVIGGLLEIKALLAVDVAQAKYVIMALGGVFMGAGFWYRHRRKKRCR